MKNRTLPLVAWIWLCGLVPISAAQQDAEWKIFNESKIPLNWGSGCLGPLWDWGMVRLFKYDCELKHEIGDALLLDGKGGLNGMFGAEVRWPYQLKTGFSYQFRAHVQPAPDFIAINSKRIWTALDGFYENGFAHFVYTPSKNENVIVTFAKMTKTGKGAMVFKPCPGGMAGRHSKPSFFCLRKPSEKTDQTPENVQWPEKREWVSIDPQLQRNLLFDASQKPIEYERPPLQKPSYPTEELAFCNDTSLIKGHIKRDGVNAFTVDYSSENLTWETLKRLCVDENIRHLFVNARLYGEKLFASVESGQLEKDAADLGGYLRGFLEEFPNLRVYLWVFEAEGRNFGKWEPPWPYSVRNSWIFHLPGQQGQNQGPLAGVYRACWTAQRSIYERVKKQVGHPDRVRIMFMAGDGMFELDAFFNAGADILISKHIERQNQNLVVANARGASRVHGKEYGFDHDCYREISVQNYAPREYEEGLRTYYYGGGKFFWDEALVGSGGCFLKGHPTAMGTAWLDFVRWASVHPVRGEPQARIAFMRSYGKLGKASPIYYRLNPDFFVMELVFPEFYHSDTSRLATGTPCGPADILPPDASLEHLKSYGAIIYLGSEGFCMDEEKFETLKSYANGGGTLVMPMSQLRRTDGSLISQDLNGFAGVTVEGERKIRGKRVAVLKPESASVLKKFEDGSPWVVKNETGKGSVYLFAPENLTDLDPGLPSKQWNNDVNTHRYASAAPPLYRKILDPLLARQAWLRLTPASDWIEYQVFRKGSSWIFAFMNHGRAGYPSGNGPDRGEWRGKVAFDLARLSPVTAETLTVFEAHHRENASHPFILKPIGAEVIGNELIVQASIDRWTEIVIGPGEKTKEDYFGTKR